MEAMENDLQTAEQNKSSRRAAILMGGAALAGLALARKAEAQYQGAALDLAVLNFALNLEYLEAQFYTLATQGKTIDQAGVTITGNNGATGGIAVTPGTVTTKNSNNYASCLVPFTTPLLQEYAMETAQEERNHVTFLQTAITNANSVAMPAIDLFNSFNTLAVAAGLGSSFDPFASETNFLLGAFIFEDVGVTAYHGAAGLLSNKTYLDKAAGIMAVEAYHAGSTRSRIYGLGASAQMASQAIATLRAAADGTKNDDVGVGTDATGAATVADVDSNALAFARTTEQVRAIVYATGLPQLPPGVTDPTKAVKNGANSGGFFPAGLNGPIF
ncbi:MAG TPA: ferritin-like domain-containing protein [Acidisarcina sp.]